MALIVAVSGCGTTPGAEESNFESGENAKGETGEVSFNLLVGDATLHMVDYELKRPGFTKTGTIDVSNAPRISAVVAGVPLGTGYTATLTADGTGPQKTFHCSGSATFDVNAPGSTPVNVPVTCLETAIPPVPVPKGANAALCALLAGAGIVLSSRRRRARTG